MAFLIPSIYIPVVNGMVAWGIAVVLMLLVTAALGEWRFFAVVAASAAIGLFFRWRAERTA